MDCTQARTRLGAFVDDELDEHAACLLATHLEGCADCRAAAASLQALRGALHQHGTRYTAPEHLRRAISASLRAAAPAKRRRPLASWPWAWINLGLSGVSSVAFAVTLAVLLAQPGAEERLDQDIVASHFRSLMPERLADVASSDQHTVKPWFSGKLDFAPPVHDLAQDGYPLVGGRLDYVGARPVAALAYRHRKHVLNLYLWPDSSRSEAPFTPATRQGFQLLSWTHDGMRHVAISDMNAQDLRQFAKLLTRHHASD